MALTTQQILTWLQKQTPRVVIAEIGYNNGATDEIMRIASRSYLSKPTDSTPNAAYIGVIKAVPSFNADASGRLNVGNLDIFNNGEFDDWLDWNWGSRQVLLGLGDPSWSRDDFIFTTLQTTAQGMTSPDQDTLRIFFSDALELLNKPIQTNLLPNTSNPIPLVYGDVFNIKPMFLESIGGASFYQVNDGTVDSLTVRGGGLPVAGVTEDLSSGKFSINPSPESEITCDVSESASIQSTADIITAIITRLGENSRIDVANFAAYKGEYPFSAGVFIDSRTNALQLIESVLAGQGVLSADIAGQYYLWRRGVETGNENTIYIDAQGFVVERGVSISSIEPPISKLRIEYRKNYTVQNDSALFGGVTAENRDIYARGSLVIDATQTLTSNPEALEYPQQKMLSVQSVDGAETEATIRLALYQKPVKIYSIEAIFDPVQIRLGDKLVLTYPRFGFDTGKVMQIIGIRWNPLQRRCQFSVTPFVNVSL